MLLFWKQHIAYWCMSAYLNAIENIAREIFILVFLLYTTHIGDEGHLHIFLSNVFSPSLSARHGRNILCQQIKYTGRENHFATWIFFIPVPVCSILERRLGFIHFFCVFSSSSSYVKLFFYCNFFLCFYAVFFCYSLASSIATVNENECISHKTIFSRFCHFQCEKIFC